MKRLPARRQRRLRLAVVAPCRWRPLARDPEVARFLLPQPQLADPPRPAWRPDAGHLAYALLGFRVVTRYELR